MEIRSYHSLPQEAVLVRTKVFVEEQGFQNEFDDIDDSALHLVAFEDGAPIGTCRLFFSDKRYDLGEVGRYRINKKLNLDTDIDVRVLTKEDIIEIIKYLIQLINSSATVDDIDHLSNRRVRTVGEQLANQFSIGLARMTRTIHEL